MRNNLEKSRDSGFGSFSNSIISETSSEESEHSTVFDNTEKRSSSGSVLNTSGYFPVTMTQIQKKISYGKSRGKAVVVQILYKAMEKKIL